MEAKQVKDLMEAYASVYTQSEEQEVLSEDLQSAVKSGLKKGSEFMKKNPVGKAIGAVIAPVGKGRGTVTKAEQEEKIKSNKQEDVDVFDLIKGHLLDEGYADTEESALVIMANMSEEWRQSIVEGVGGYDDPVAGPHTPIGKTVRAGLNTAKDVATKVVNRTVPPNIRSAVAKKAKEVTSGRYGPPGSNY
jgi:hypothetical protein